MNTRRRRMRTLAALLTASIAFTVASAMPAEAKQPAPSRTVTTPTGLSLTVSPFRLLNPAGAKVKVTGKGYNPLVGIYVAFCVTPPKGEVPTPCGGGAAMAGSSASAWISSNPPPYGAELATPYGKGGTFAVTLRIAPMIGDIDCRTVSCSVVTRADHTRSSERAYDVFAPVTFK